MTIIIIIIVIIIIIIIIIIFLYCGKPVNYSYSKAFYLW